MHKQPMDIASRDALLELMRNRHSCRQYLPDDVDEETLQSILTVGLQAPSGCNFQPYSVIVVRKAETKNIISEICGQSFIKSAPVNLVFLLDWHKLSLYASHQQAPFLSNESLDDNLTGYADVVCAMSHIEIAALFYGLGCCFIGNCLGHSAPLKKALDLKEKTYPVLIMTLGYPAVGTSLIPKLPYNCMVFEESYNSVSDETILDGFHKKYGHLSFELSKDPKHREHQLNQINQALQTTYSPEEAADILSDIQATNRINEMQRRFALQNCAHESYAHSEEVRFDMASLGIML